jgi:protein-S-isoprenylcysteine O-methyltransferase Ste14
MPGWALNIPLPEPHLIGLTAGLATGWAMPWTVPLPTWPRIAALGLAVLGLGLATCATWASRNTTLAAPDRLVVGWPYSASRNPMYVGWSLAYLGAATALAHGWLLLLTPGVLLGAHLAIRREERRLLARFGATYASYAATVRRYL